MHVYIRRHSTHHTTTAAGGILVIAGNCGKDQCLVVMGLWSNCLSIDLAMPRPNSLFPRGMNNNGQSKIVNYNNVVVVYYCCCY